MGRDILDGQRVTSFGGGRNFIDIAVGEEGRGGGGGSNRMVT